MRKWFFGLLIVALKVNCNINTDPEARPFISENIVLKENKTLPSKLVFWCIDARKL